MKIKKVNCLIDFFSEEIPASMQLFLEKELNLLFEKVLNKVLLNYEKIEILSSPRHHCVLIHHIDSVQKDQSLDIKGPRIEAHTSCTISVINCEKVLPLINFL